MKAITAATSLTLLVLNWWDQAYNHGAYARGLENMIVSLRHGLGV
jgi:hypothetical protein